MAADALAIVQENIPWLPNTGNTDFVIGYINRDKYPA
jgi:hypothetical protein